jgi:hypothetical protein
VRLISEIDAMAHASTRCFSLAEGVTAPFTGFIAI